MHFTKQQADQSWDSPYLTGKMKETCLVRFSTVVLSNNYAVLPAARKMCFNLYCGLSHMACWCAFVLTSSHALPSWSQNNVWCKQVEFQISHFSDGLGIQHLKLFFSQACSCTSLSTDFSVIVMQAENPQPFLGLDLK